MAFLVIGCELNKPTDCEPVQTTLESWGAVKLLKSMWLLDTPLGADYVRSALQDVVDGRDTLAVIEVREGTDWSATNAASPGSDWLRTKLGGH